MLSIAYYYQIHKVSANSLKHNIENCAYCYHLKAKIRLLILFVNCQLVSFMALNVLKLNFKCFVKPIQFSFLPSSNKC